MQVRVDKDISIQHQQYFRAVFNQFDQDGDNCIDKDELILLMAALGEHYNQMMIDQLISQIDQDSNGTIDFEQFLQLMSNIMKKSSPKNQLNKAFKIFDRDGNGSISSNQLKQVMKNLQQDMTNNQIEQIYKWANRQGKQELDQQLFIKLLMETSNNHQ